MSNARKITQCSVLPIKVKKLGDELRLLRVMTGLNWGGDGNKRENGCVCVCVCVCVGIQGEGEIQG